MYWNDSIARFQFYPFAARISSWNGPICFLHRRSLLFRSLLGKDRNFILFFPARRFFRYFSFVPASEPCSWNSSTITRAHCCYSIRYVPEGSMLKNPISSVFSHFFSSFSFLLLCDSDWHTARFAAFFVAFLLEERHTNSVNLVFYAIAGQKIFNFHALMPYANWSLSLPGTCYHYLSLSHLIRS